MRAGFVGRPREINKIPAAGRQQTGQDFGPLISDLTLDRGTTDLPPPSPHLDGKPHKCGAVAFLLVASAMAANGAGLQWDTIKNMALA